MNGTRKIACESCPYVADEYVLGMQIIKCWCNKLGGRIIEFGSCDDEEGRMSKNPYRREHTLNSYKREVKYKQKIKKLAKLCEEKWYAPAYPVGVDGHYIDDYENMTYVKRVWRGSRSKYLKQQSNRKLRRYKGDVPNFGGYKRVFDFWWEMY